MNFTLELSYIWACMTTEVFFSLLIQRVYSLYIEKELPTKMYIKSVPYLHQKNCYLGIKYGAFLCFGANVPH